MENYNAALNAVIRAQARARGLSGAELGRLIGLSRQNVSQRNTGRARWSAEEVQRLEYLGFDCSLNIAEDAS